MVRTQIQLTEEQHRLLKRWADRLGISMAEAVRRCVADRLSRERVGSGRADRVREAAAVIGKSADPGGPSQVARDHDDHLTGAYGE